MVYVYFSVTGGGGGYAMGGGGMGGGAAMGNMNSLQGTDPHQLVQH